MRASFCVAEWNLESLLEIWNLYEILVGFGILHAIFSGVGPLGSVVASLFFFLFLSALPVRHQSRGRETISWLQEADSQL